jgi:hypothetical protein
MKRIAGVIILALTFLAPAVFAQEEHGEFGVFMNYTRLRHLDANFLGPGARLSFNAGKYVQLEGEMAYDLERSFVTSTTAGTTTTFTRSGLRLLNGMFGPKFQTSAGPFKAFFTVKGGLLNFSVSNQGAATGFVGAVNNIPHGDTNGVLYPGGGIEAYWKRIGFRLDIGDEIYFDNGANHNLKITFGPHFRF